MEPWEAVALPFKNYNSTLLPTADQIRACQTVLRERSAVKVVAVTPDLVAKYGGGVDESEGQALIYLERYVPDVPAPRLHAMYHDSGQLFLVMQRVRGLQLDEVWHSMSEIEKTSIVAQLRRIFDTMRQAVCPWTEFFGGLDGGSLRHELFYSQAGDRIHLGPFHSEARLVRGLTDNFRALTEHNGRPDFKVRFYEAHLGRVLTGHRSVLTHGDVQMNNIMVVENSAHASDGATRSFDVVLIDWEVAGWYPAFWEHYATSCTFDYIYWETDWCWLTGEFLEVWPAEMALLRMLDKDMFS